MSTTIEHLNQQFKSIFDTDDACIRESENHIGYCDACGIVDHHLVKGMCAPCANKYQSKECDK